MKDWTDIKAFARYGFHAVSDTLLLHDNGSEIEVLGKYRYHILMRVRTGSIQAFTSNPDVSFEFAIDRAGEAHHLFPAKKRKI